MTEPASTTTVQNQQRDAARDMREIISDIVGETTEQDDRSWEEWVARGRSPSGLIGRNVRDVFKARAIAYEFDPSRILDWKRDDEHAFEIARLPPNLLKFVIALLERNVPISRSFADNDVRRRSYRYDDLILQALAVLPEDDGAAMRVFGLYQINDPVSFLTTDESFGYKPFRRLLVRRNVPEQWKRLADEKMREIIRAEQAGTAKPRVEREGALQCYTEHMQIGFFDPDGFPYSATPLTSQVDFVLGLPNTDGIKLFESHHVGTIFTMLGGDDHRDLRHRFARHVMLGNRGECGVFKIYDEKMYGAAVAILHEFGASDPELRKRLEEIVTDGEDRLREKREAERRKEVEEATALARLQ